MVTAGPCSGPGKPFRILAIVGSIVTAHQADLQARPRPHGGLEIVIELLSR